MSSGTGGIWFGIAVTSSALRVNLVNRLQKVLEAANLKLAAVATDVMGASRAMLNAIAGQSQPSVLAELALKTVARSATATTASFRRAGKTTSALDFGAHY